MLRRGAEMFSEVAVVLAKLVCWASLECRAKWVHPEHEKKKRRCDFTVSGLAVTVNSLPKEPTSGYPSTN
jgi:hypothetical protein